MIYSLSFYTCNNGKPSAWSPQYEPTIQVVCQSFRCLISSLTTISIQSRRVSPTRALYCMLHFLVKVPVTNIPLIDLISKQSYSDCMKMTNRRQTAIAHKHPILGARHECDIFFSVSQFVQQSLQPSPWPFPISFSPPCHPPAAPHKPKHADLAALLTSSLLLRSAGCK